jgi:hypothetical protein
LVGFELFKLSDRPAFELAADSFGSGDYMRAGPGPECEASDPATFDLGREPKPHSLIFKVADSAVFYLARVRWISEIRTDLSIVWIRAQATRSGAKLRSFSTAFR